MNVGKKKVDWVMADGTKYTAKKAAALTQLAKRANTLGGSPERKRGEDEDDNNNGCAGSDGGSSNGGRTSGSSNSSSNSSSNNNSSSSSSNSSSSSSDSSNGSHTVAVEATKAFVTETTMNGGGTHMTGSILPGE